jgi:hypothetical protein
MEVTRKELYRMYVESSMTAKEIAAQLGFKSPESIYVRLRKYNIPIRSNRDAQRPISIERDTLFDLYVAQKLSLSAIALRLGVREEKVRRCLVVHNIPRRSKADGFGGHNKGSTLSQEHRRKISKTRKERFANETIRHWNKGKECPEHVRKSISKSLLNGRTPAPSFYGKDWIIQRTSCLQRDHHTCQQCGATNNLEVHHWTPYRFCYDNNLDNLITICADCHRGIHRQYKVEGFIEEVEGEYYA